MGVALGSGQILCIVGARPNFMKIAPIMRAFSSPDSVLSASLLHTGQHYDAAMKHAFFEQLHIPEPDIDLEVGSGSHAQQTADIMKRFEPVLDKEPPLAVLVVGDVNSTIACALVAVKKGIPVIHVEAGLRSGDKGMPEEINRILTDQLSELLFTTEASAQENLEREGIASDKVHFVGNVMIDTLLFNLDDAVSSQITLANNTEPRDTQDLRENYGLVTLHRPSNVDDPVVLERLLKVLAQISRDTPLFFPIHPRTESCIAAAGLANLLTASDITTLPPQGYLEMLGLMKDARVVLTDSGGIQEETTALGIPCITLRENTERPITVNQGTNTVVGTNVDKILACYKDVIKTGGKVGRVPELWDGMAASRLVEVINLWARKRSV